MGAEHLLRAEVAQTLGHRGVALDVGEENGNRAVGGGVRGEIGTLALRHRSDGVDRGLDGGLLDALSAEFQAERLVRHGFHREALRGVEPLIHELEHFLPIARLAAREQHAGVMELRAHERDGRARRRVHHERGLEMPLGINPPGHRRGEEAELLRDRARAGPGVADDHVAARIGQQ